MNKFFLSSMLLGLLLACRVEASPSAPNIILIYVDDLGYGDLGAYGSEVNSTPHVDRLAEEGMRFTSYYSASSVCTPSRAALLTGGYPGRVSFDAFGSNQSSWVLFPGFAEGLHPQELLLPEFLKWKGYATAHIGKWHLGDQPEHLPTRHGFDSYYGVPYSNDMAILPSRSGSPPMPLMRDEEVVQEQPTQAPLIERFTEEAVRFIRKNQNRPFFLYFAHLHVHLPHYVMNPFLANSHNDRYGAAVAAVDWSTGVLVAELRRLGLEGNTIVIFTSDNGSRAQDEGGSNGPLRGRKGQTWEGGMRVPCIVKWPGNIPTGSVTDELVTAMVFYPTLARIVGYTLPDEDTRDGHDILAIWLDDPGAKSPYDAFFYYFVQELQAVRVGNWKLRFRNRDCVEPELFDLAMDLGETRNVAPDHPEVVSDLLNYLDAMRLELGDSRTGVKGLKRRPAAVIENPRPLTKFEEDYPYIKPVYLLDEAG